MSMCGRRTHLVMLFCVFVTRSVSPTQGHTRTPDGRRGAGTGRLITNLFNMDAYKEFVLRKIQPLTHTSPPTPGDEINQTGVCSLMDLDRNLSLQKRLSFKISLQRE